MNTIDTGGHSLVLGGGGVAGIAWMTGLLFGLEKAGLEVSAFDMVVGTSAGAAVGAQLYSGLSLQELMQRQTDPALQVAELVPPISKFRLFLKFLPALLVRKNPGKFRRRIGAMAQKSSTVEPGARYRVIEQRLPSHDWPDMPLKLVVVNADSGEMEVFDRYCGVSLTDAVAASCAVPGIWPAVNIGGGAFIDGGLRSATNADLAIGSRTALILAPMGYHSFLSTGSGLKHEVEELEATGTRVVVVVPDEASVEAIGDNPLDPATRIPSASAGEKQAMELADRVISLLAARSH